MSPPLRPEAQPPRVALPDPTPVKLLKEHRVAVLTGASGGLGRAIAASLARSGFHLVLHYHRNAEVAEALADGLRNGINTTTFQADLARSVGADALMAHAVREFGQVDVLVNNAGVMANARLTKLKDEDWDLLMRANVYSAMATTRAALPGMMARRWGRVVNLTSIAAQKGFPGTAAYAASKAALIGLTKATAAEGAPHGVTCNAVAPGFIDAGLGNALTPAAQEAMVTATPAGRAGSAEEVADLIAYLVSPSAAFITGQVVAVNGGLQM